jgi:dUTP pyrophosphatase
VYLLTSKQTGMTVDFFKIPLKFKKLVPEAVIPSYAKEGDAGLDLTATSIVEENYHLKTYKTGLAVEIPQGYVGLIFPRSSISKYHLSLANSVAVIDSGYRGELILKFNVNVRKANDPFNEYKVGDRVGQLLVIPYPTMKIIEMDELSETQRGEGGFGSSGK